jgi:hypothetical protein
MPTYMRLSMQPARSAVSLSRNRCCLRAAGDASRDIGMADEVSVGSPLTRGTALLTGRAGPPGSPR